MVRKMVWKKIERIKKYRKKIDVFDLTNTAGNFFANRILVHNCSFCTDILSGTSRTNFDREIGKKIRYHTPRYVVNLLKELRIRWAIDFVSLMDENFTVDKKRIYEICDLMESEELIPNPPEQNWIYWGGASHVNTLDPELMAKMRSCGLDYIDLGLESGSDDMLKAIKKGATVEANQRAIDLCKKYEVNPICNLIIGYNEETVKSIYETAYFMAKNQIIGRPFLIQPYPLTELFEKNKDKILQQYNGSLEDFVLALGDATEFTVNLTSFSDAELLGLRELITTHDLERIRKFAKTKGITIGDETPSGNLSIGASQIP